MKIFRLFITLVIFTATTNLVVAQDTVPVQENTVKTSAVKVKGVTCKNDLASIAGNVEKLKGVSACQPEKAGPTTTFKIKFNPKIVSEKEIFAAIEGTPGCENPNDRPYKVKQ